MNKVLLLVIVLAALVGASIFVKKNRESVVNRGVQQGADLRERLLPDLNVNSIREIRVRTGEESVSVKKSDAQWVVTERDNYPASFEKIGRALVELSEQEISTKRVIGESAWSEINVDLPTEGEEETGKLVELVGEDGEVAYSFVLGDTVNTSGGRSSASPFGGGSNERFVRIPDDGNTIWGVNNAFYEFETSPEMWVNKDFIKVADIQSVEVKTPDPKELWKAERKDKDGEFTLVGAAAGQSLDTSKVALGALLTSPTFNDVHGKAKAAELLKDAAEATITTFDGFTYKVKAAKVDQDGSSKYHMSVAVSAKLPEKREAPEDESEEDKKKADAQFETQKKTLQTKLEKEKAMAGWVYEVSEYTINNLLKKRSEIVTSDAGEDAAPAPSTGSPVGVPGLGPTPGATATPPQPAATAAPKLPSKPISVTTPPVAVPPLPKTEIKPAPNPDANPATEAPKVQE